MQPISQIIVGDSVRTHRGIPRIVTKVYQREYSGDLLKLTINGVGESLIVTPNHPILALAIAASPDRKKKYGPRYFFNKPKYNRGLALDCGRAIGARRRSSDSATHEDMKLGV